MLHSHTTITLDERHALPGADPDAQFAHMGHMCGGVAREAMFGCVVFAMYMGLCDKTLSQTDAFSKSVVGPRSLANGLL